MIVYVDPSVLARTYFADEPGHAEAVALLGNRDVGLVTGSWTRIEVAGAIVRAARAGRGDEAGLLELLTADLAVDGPVTVIVAPQSEAEARAYELVRDYGIRAMDAWHLAVATFVLPVLAEPGEQRGFATRDEAQASVAVNLGFVTV